MAFEEIYSILFDDKKRFRIYAKDQIVSGVGELWIFIYKEIILFDEELKKSN